MTSSVAAKVALAAGLGLAIAFAYADVREYGFLVWWDDPAYVAGNRMVLRGLTFEGVGWAFTGIHVGNYHPLTWLSHMLDVELFGANAGAHHVVNVVLHALNTALLFGALAALTSARGRSLAAASLFAVHPALVEAVAWIAERKELLAAGLAFGSLWCWVPYATRGSRRGYAGALTLYALSLLAKPTPITLPFLLLILDAWPLGRLRGVRRIRGRIVEKLPFFVLAAAAAVVTLIAQPPVIRESFSAMGPPVALARYLAHALWPVELAPFYPERAPSGVAVAAALLLGGALLAGAAALRRRAPWVGVGLLWFGGTLLPVAGLVPLGDHAMADRYLYLALPGLLVAVCWTVASIERQISRGRALLISTCALVLIAGALQTRSAVAFWRDGHALFSRSIEVEGRSFVAHTGLGYTLLARYRFEEAEEQFRAALGLWPDYARAHRGLGVCQLVRGAVDDAILSLERAAELNPGVEGVHGLLGGAYERQGRTVEAAGSYRTELEHNPYQLDALVRLSVLHATEPGLLDPPAAVALATRACEVTGYNRARELDVLAAALAQSGRFEEAAERAREAARIARLDENERLVRAIEHRLRRYEANEMLRAPP